MNKFNLEFLREVRFLYFDEIGKSRWKRVIVCIFFIASVWIFADILSGNLLFNIWHDVICVVLGFISERLLPWGKPNIKTETYDLAIKNNNLLKDTNKKLNQAIKEANVHLHEYFKLIDKQK